MQAFGGKRCHFLRRYQKTKKPKILESWRRRGLKSPKSLFFFFVFLVFSVPLQENASFWWKTLPFPEEVPKKPKKPKILESWRRRGLKSPKSLVFWVFWYPSRKMQAFGGKRCHFLRRYKIKPKTSSSTSKQKHIFRFDKNPIDSSCFQVPDSGFKFQDLAIARISLVHSTATYKDRGKVRYLQCFLLRYGSLSTLQDAPGELQKLLGWILRGADHIYIYIHMYMYTQISTYAFICT